MSGRAVVGRRTFGERFGMSRSRRESFIHCSEKDRKGHVKHSVLELAKLNADLRIGSGLPGRWLYLNTLRVVRPFLKPPRLLGDCAKASSSPIWERRARNANLVV